MISLRSADRAASLPGTVPRLRTDFARVKIVLTDFDGVEGDFAVGVDRMRLDGVKSETVRLPETGVNGTPVDLDIVDFVGVFGGGGGMFSRSSVFSRLDILDGRETSASVHTS